MVQFYHVFDRPHISPTNGSRCKFTHDQVASRYDSSERGLDEIPEIKQMNATTIDKRIKTTLSKAQAELQTEARRLEREIQAYSEFEKQLESITVPKSSPVSTVGSIQLDRSSSIDQCTEIRESFEATVMAVPHYSEDYDESFIEHFAAEFTPEAAALVTNSNEIPPQLHSLLQSQVTSAIEDRNHLLSSIDSEQDAVAESKTRLQKRCQQLTTLTKTEIDQLDFAGLEAQWTYLAQQQQLCDTIAADRQQHIIATKRTVGATNTTSDLYAYLYQDLDVTYPILSKIAEIGETIHRQQTQIESAIVDL